MNKIQQFLQKLDAWRRSRGVRRAVRAAGKVADTTAAGVGFALRLAVRSVATVLLVLIVTALLFTCIFAVYVKTCLTEGLDISLEEASLSLSSTIWYEDEYGNWQEMTKLYSQENRTWVELDNIPVYLQQAAVAIEDKRFYEHKGVDWYRTVAAFVNMFLGMKDNFGGSTLTQQLIKNLTEDDDVTVQRKLQEIFRALEFEKKYTKDEIMTWYLNEIYLGQGCYGVGAAARAYFGKDVWELNLAECASLIGITNNPSKYDLYIYPENNRIRAHTILRQMYEQDYITYEQYQEAIAYEVQTAASDDDEDSTIYTWYEETIIDDAVRDLAAARGISEAQADKLIRTGGYNIYACVDMRIQKIVDSYYQNLSRLPQPYRRSSQQLRSAIVIMDPRTGDIVALAGDVGEKKINLGLNLATEAKRPPGSSFKPLAVYAPALDTGLVNQNTGVDDSPSIQLSGTSWYPRNSGGYSGVITVRTALINSKNTIAAQLLDHLGLSTSWEYLTERFCITSLVPNDGTKSYTDYAYAPLALGQLSEGITVREMAQAYTAFPNEGLVSIARTYSMITDQQGNVVLDNSTKQHYAIKANTAANLCSMMQAAVSYGTGTEAYFGSTAVAGKTGTTSDDKDRYFCGFTMYYVAAVWTGYEIPERMYFNGNPACQIFRTIMSEIHRGYSWWDFPSYYINSARLKGAEPSESPSPSPTVEPCPPHDYVESGGEATCTEAGIITYTCTKCEDTYNEEVEALGHDYQVTDPGDATCTTGGTVVSTCSRCGDTVTEAVGSLGHDFSVQLSRTEPTCSHAGSVSYRCSRCSETTTETLPATGNHSWSETARTEPTCGAEGSVTKTCSSCGTSTTETLPATGSHSWSETARTEPTCGAEGSVTKTCSSCGASTTETLSATGSHSWSETGRTNPTCTADGVISYTCAGCGQSKTESNGSATGHSFSEGVCSACGAADPDYTPPTEAPTPAAEG